MAEGVRMPAVSLKTNLSKGYAVAMVKKTS
jgi:hypothetical protein